MIGPASLPRGGTRTGAAVTVAAYVLVFWFLLPAALWIAAEWVDARFGWERFEGWRSGWLLFAAGAALVFGSIAELWKRGGGLPVSALPPPRLTTRGLYGSMRHPIYFGFNVAVAGLGLAIGSPGLAAVVAPLFAILWVTYAKAEERLLRRRFGAAYEHYARIVGLVPRFPLYTLLRATLRFRLIPVTVVDHERLRVQGGAVVVANHASYLDPMFVGWAGDRAGRRVRFVATAEVFRNRWSRWVLTSIFAPIPVRRYRPDGRALRDVLRYLAAGEMVCIFPEGERTPLGRLQPPLEATARFLATVGYPVIPVGITGNYDQGPRWSGTLRRALITVRVGAPLRFEGEQPAALIHRSLRALLDADPQSAQRGRLDVDRLSVVLWACPRCFTAEQWDVRTLRCAQCSRSWQWLPDGTFSDGGGAAVSLADLAAPLWEAPPPRLLVAPAAGWREASVTGPIGPLQDIGTAELHATPDGIHFGSLVVSLPSIRSVTVERADTLQIATDAEMWQFTFAPDASPFRFQRALVHWKTARAVAV